MTRSSPGKTEAASSGRTMTSSSSRQLCCFTGTRGDGAAPTLVRWWGGHHPSRRPRTPLASQGRPLGVFVSITSSRSADRGDPDHAAARCWRGLAVAPALVPHLADRLRVPRPVPTDGVARPGPRRCLDVRGGGPRGAVRRRPRGRRPTSSDIVATCWSGSPISGATRCSRPRSPRR